MKINLPKGKSFTWVSTSVLFLFLLVAGNVKAQQGKTVSGLITEDGTQGPLPGVNIVEKGTTNGTQTDFDGNYAITLTTDNAVLVLSYLGYSTQEISVGGRTELNATLQEDTQALEEVVVVGYGTQKKSDLTGAITSVGTEALNERNMTSPLEAIQGNVAGVQISSSTGRIGDGFDIVIRGKNSTTGDSEPLYVVDGVPTDGIDFLNPQDIAQIDILKDASSTAIYGSRGTNGVVIVTTKSGTSAKGGINISFDSYLGVKETARLPKMMGGDKWWYYHQSAYLATTATDPMTISPELLQEKVVGTANSVLKQRADNGEVFDWYDAVLKTGIQQNNYLNISGRADNGLSYNIGFGLQNETGNVDNEELDKYTFKIGVNHRISDKFSTGINLTMAHTIQNDGSDVAMREAFRLNPFLTPYAIDDNGNETDELFPQPGKLVYPTSGDYAVNKTSTYNPLLEIKNSTDEYRRWNGIGNVFFQYSPLEWLSFKTTYSAGLNTERRGRAWGAMTNTGIGNDNLPSSELTKEESFNYSWDNQFNIDYTFNEKHNVKLLGLQSLYSDRYESSFSSSRNQPFETGFYNLGSGEQGTFNLNSNFVKQTLSSYAVRLNYSFDNRYLVTLSNRWDGSSLLSESKRWDSFPSAAVAWRISEESFMQEQGTISNLKLRASFGYTGNNNIDAYKTKNILDQSTYYDFGGTAANGFLASSLANPYLGWERTRELNVGVDFGFLKNRISGSVDIYDRLSEDLLEDLALPLESGYPVITANTGSVSNKGVEVALRTLNIDTEKISWETSFTFTKNTNTLESFQGQDESGLVFATDESRVWRIIGESLDAQYNYKFDGIWQADEVAQAESYGQGEGQAKVVDFNGDGVISPGEGKLGIENDRVVLGSSDPTWSGSVFTRLRVGNFDISASAITNQGVFVYSQFHQNFTDVRDRGRQKLDIADWYIPANGANIPAQFSNSYPQARNAGQYWRNDQVGYYRDASFVKVKNIALGYNFEKNTLDRLGLKSLRIYANVLNPFVFTDYDGYDPEWASAGYDVGRVSSITYQLGLSVKL
ncbi:TonB-dependent receptor [Maribacter polysiphoniae]|uniref:TonB-dependent receptor n=1 Tax=Maribacter polysiphoniae TaxID=429344 RepID=A0A316E7L8_9FLAO|nr:TonB-dependent receptor [Maribacter polysiphoniae]MBD1262356.1 TonB-dependent receptor [Maribacter polysiphoniae]PWK26056.1 TonB-linked SusC/RagA family outer membrane protein [Maribacter polysiphoniae]